MKSESRIGSMFSSRRIELSISLEQAARDTNIRARMLETLESGDFSNYPPRGHAIGMLSSYARYLGLNPATVLEIFDAEYQEYETNREMMKSAGNTRMGLGRFGERANGPREKPIDREASAKRSHLRPRGDEVDASNTGSMSKVLESEARAREAEHYHSGSVRVVGKRPTGSFGRVRTSRERTGSFSATSSTTDTGRMERSSTGSMRRTSSTSTRRGSTGRMERSSTGSMRADAATETRKPSGALARRNTATGSMRRTSQTGSLSRRSTGELSSSDRDKTPNFFGVEVAPDESSPKRNTRRRSSMRTKSDESSNAARPDENIIERLTRVIKSIFSERRTRFIALGLTAILIGVIIAASFLIGTAGKGDTGVIPVQGGAVDDTTTTDGDNAAHKTITTANGNPVTIRVEVADGQTSLISNPYPDANPYSGTAVGPFSREFPVTESFTATFGNPNAVTVTENGNKVDIASDDAGHGVLNISVQAASSS